MVNPLNERGYEEKEFQLPETFLKKVKGDRESNIVPLPGENLIFFPA
jgi:hypothetical protein